jgi:hypothetical protein
MFRRRTQVAACVAVLALAGALVTVSPAAAADPIAACDPAVAPALDWSAPSFVAWGRQVRVGANIADGVDGPLYEDGSAKLVLDAGSARASSDPVDSDLEFAVSAPVQGATMNATAMWTLLDDATGARCSQSASFSIALGVGKTLRYRAGRVTNGIAWTAINPGDCHDIAQEPMSLTVQQGSVKRRLSVPDECGPVGGRRVSTPDWTLALAGGHFELRAVSAHSSIKARMRYALRVGQRRVASGSLSLVRIYRPARVIVAGTPAFFNECVHGSYQFVGNGCVVPGLFRLSLALV